MKSPFYIKKGFTLFESMIALSIVGAAAAGVMTYTAEENNRENASVFIQELSHILKAVDNRLYVDGYHADRWSSLSWNDFDSISSDLIDGELNASTNNKCPSGSWNPSFRDQEELSIIPCNMWKNKSYNYITSAEMTTDVNNYIQDFEIIVDFETTPDLSEDIKAFRAAMLGIFAENDPSSAGNHYISFVNGLDTNNEWTTAECLNDLDNCQLKASFHRAGGAEYLRSDGGNSMVGLDAHLSFVESKEQAPLQCMKWTRNGTGWRLEGSVDCGIGLYEDSPVAVELAVELGGFDEIYMELDRLCDVFEVNNDDKVVRSPNQSPCGFHSMENAAGDGEIMVQVVENTSATRGLYENLYVENGVLRSVDSEVLEGVMVATFNEVEADNVDAFKVEVNEKVVVNGEVNADRFELEGKLTVQDRAYINNINGEYVNLSEEIEATRLYLEEGKIVGIKKVGSLDVEKVDMDTLYTETGSFKGVNMLLNSKIQAETITADMANIDTLEVEEILPEVSYACKTGETLVGDKCQKQERISAVLPCPAGYYFRGSIGMGGMCVKKDYTCSYDSSNNYFMKSRGGKGTFRYDGRNIPFPNPNNLNPYKRYNWNGVWYKSSKLMRSAGSADFYDICVLDNNKGFIPLGCPDDYRYEYNYGRPICIREEYREADKAFYSKFNVHASQTVTSNIGNFDNINADIAKMKEDLQDLQEMSDYYKQLESDRNKRVTNNYIHNRKWSDYITTKPGNSCESKCLNTGSRDQYQRCMKQCSHGGGSGGQNQCGANGCGNNGGGR